MKRDMDLIRKLLLFCEGIEGNDVSSSTLLEGYAEEQIRYHAYLLVDAALAKGMNVSHLGCVLPQYLLNSLTWAGHEFLDAARDETTWNKAKTVFTSIGGFMLPVLIELLLKSMKEKVGL